MDRRFEDLGNDLKFKDYMNRLFLDKALEYRKNNILEIELTNKCSIGCFYCGATTGGRHIFLDFDIVRKSITDFVESRTAASITPLFSITGGDPLEYPQFEELLDFLGMNKLRFTLKLNPSTITNSVYRIISKSSCDSVKLTFLGLGTQEKIRKRDTLDILSDVTGRFKKENMSVIWHFSVGEFNRDDLLESLGFVLSNRPSSISIGRLARIGRLDERNYPDEITPSAYRDFLKTILLFFYNNKRNGFNLVFKDKLWVPFLCEEGILAEKEMLKPGTRLGCDAGERLLVLTYSGDLISCGLLPDPVLAMASDLGFHDRLMSVRDKYVPSCDEGCSGCKYLEICRGCRGVAAGSKCRKDPQCWL